MEGSKLGRASRPGKVPRGTSEVARRTYGARKLADRAWLQEERARWLGELAAQESKLARVSSPGKVARGTSEVARRTSDATKRPERGGSANLRCRKVNLHGLADPARLQEARARWLGELAAQESKLARVSSPGKVARGTSETRQGCKGHERGGSANLRCNKVNSHGLAEPARLQEARARWFGELAVQESKLARVSRPGKFARGTREVARRTCDARKLQEARARWLGDLAVQESKLARVTRRGKVARGERIGSANLRCRKVISYGLADPARSKEARAMWLGELTVQESKLARDSRPGKVARGTSEVARRTCGAGK
ncbi:hypothetical protein CRG98_045128 [Punica granatum]|uniref:Uncharacterized protein n=1 Tax=Punica granatum TaxID=22663 RepID=A0A2I0HRZ1_PUNGR|nr:hypothetical protein CRG98_045128 [Punica granatum]